MVDKFNAELIFLKRKNNNKYCEKYLDEIVFVCVKGKKAFIERNLTSRNLSISQ